MELKAGQIWVRNIDEDPEEYSVEALDVAKVNDDGTFSGGFHTVGGDSKFEWRENVPKSEILGNKTWGIFGAMETAQLLKSRANSRKMFWKEVKKYDELQNAPADGISVLFKDGTSVFVEGAEVVQYQDGKILVGNKDEEVLASFEQDEIRGWLHDFKKGEKNGN